MIFTEAQTIEEAISVIIDRSYARRKKKNYEWKIKKKGKSLRQQFGDNKGAQRFKPITLSDRVVPGSATRLNPLRQHKKPEPPPAWSREKVIEGWKTGYFKVTDLMKLAKVSALQIKLWIYGPDWKPMAAWGCSNCHVRNSYHDEHCKNCGTKWDHNLIK